MPLTATITQRGSGRKGANKCKSRLAYNASAPTSAPEPMAAGSGSGVDYYGAAVVIQTAARAFLARRCRRSAAARKIQAAFQARQAVLLEAFIGSLVFFPELGDIC